MADSDRAPLAGLGNGAAPATTTPHSRTSPDGDQGREHVASPTDARVTEQDAAAAAPQPQSSSAPATSGYDKPFLLRLGALALVVVVVAAGVAALAALLWPKTYTARA